MLQVGDIIWIGLGWASLALILVIGAIVLQDVLKKRRQRSE